MRKTSRPFLFFRPDKFQAYQRVKRKSRSVFQMQRAVNLIHAPHAAAQISVSSAGFARIRFEKGQGNLGAGGFARNQTADAIVQTSQLFLPQSGTAVCEPPTSRMASL